MVGLQGWLDWKVVFTSCGLAQAASTSSMVIPRCFILLIIYPYLCNGQFSVPFLEVEADSGGRALGKTEDVDTAGTLFGGLNGSPYTVLQQLYLEGFKYAGL